MQIIDFGVPQNVDVVVCLGEFDSLHSGHAQLFNTGAELAKCLNCQLAVLTFCECGCKLNGKISGVVYTFDEKVEILKHYSIDYIINVNFNEEFASESASRFLSELSKTVNLKGIICGKDFRFGKNANGNVEYLLEYFSSSGITIKALDFVLDEANNKISTTEIKNCLLCGDIVKANNMLGRPYSITSKVERGRMVGRQIGFPTANMKVDAKKVKLKRGVYATHVVIGGKEYKAITNYGTAPTFNVGYELIETFIDGFHGDIYDSNLTVYFDLFIREIKKFNSVDDLKEQLNCDLKVIR